MPNLRARLESGSSSYPRSVLIETAAPREKLTRGTQFMGTLLFHETDQGCIGNRRQFIVTLEQSGGYELHLK